MLRRFPLNRDGTFIENFTTENDLWPVLLALHFANKHLRGIKRNDGSDEITHATAACCGLIDRGITQLVPRISLKLVCIILSVSLLHDVVENTEVTVENVRKVFGSKIAHQVDLLTKKPEHKKNIGKYYRLLGESIVAVLVKAVDKLIVAGTIIKVAENPERIEKQANEVRILLSVMKKMRNRYPEFKGVLINCRDTMKMILGSMEKHIEVLRKNEKLKKENENLKKRLKCKKCKK